ncbi:hypothetical protein V5O48_010013 [Marasmius crinis-equi]|uniref:N-acetyltransferase domain-containing protein n=1 Tax=Marasmius crinis-equi TaxID=585013 RepID=A0ABR3F780_9AGAR
MSAYGAIERSGRQGVTLPSTIWSGKSRNDLSARVTIHHLTLETAQVLPGLLEHLALVFAKEVDDGRTYPQEGSIDSASFRSYFFAADVLVAVKLDDEGSEQDGAEIGIGIEEARRQRLWEDCVAGFYYICNAGFVVPPVHRGSGYGSLLAKSYLYYAPRLGYKASVFNLVYVNNVASVKLWERLGFTKAGRIPHAGRLKTPDGKGEEYMDAWVIYKSFEETG